MADGQTGKAPIQSEFADDPEMAELLELFVEELPDRARDLAEALTSGDVNRLRVLSHQMKGSAPGYGFSQLGSAAGEIEHLVTFGPEGDMDLGELKRRVDELVGMCERVQGPGGQAG
ncbi:MAG: hypothetical protein CMJ31_02580 [Phycisphaerae bacterium]|nr:hypothetical protein [Phycisphaerae bacterium]|tara:strand:+ start:103 stop:453 length:351 start_codon:yes stop_codon:yes gene_type:complete